MGFKRKRGGGEEREGERKEEMMTIVSRLLQFLDL
jgi:hypothetical protein